MAGDGRTPGTGRARGVTFAEVIDAHVHVGLDKYGPIEAFLAVMDDLGMGRAILVQHIGQYDNAYLTGCVRRFPARFVAIGGIDPADPAAPERLERDMHEGGLAGVRLPAAASSTGPDPLAIWRRAAKLGAIVSVSGPFEDLISDAFESIVAGHPGVRFRFEHLGWLKLASERAPYARFRRFLRLARYPNTFVMLSGFYLNSTSPYPYPTSADVVALAYRAFGAERLMWSGDWNRPDLAPGDYRREIDLIGGAFPVDSESDRRKILGGTAARLFRFGEADR